MGLFSSSFGIWDEFPHGRAGIFFTPPSCFPPLPSSPSLPCAGVNLIQKIPDVLCQSSTSLVVGSGPWNVPPPLNPPKFRNEQSSAPNLPSWDLSDPTGSWNGSKRCSAKPRNPNSSLEDSEGSFLAGWSTWSWSETQTRHNPGMHLGTLSLWS